MAKKPTFYEVITAAINDLAEHGYDSQKRVNEWSLRIKEAAKDSLISDFQLQRELRNRLGQQYKYFKKAIVKTDIGAFTLAKVDPKLRKELDRRIVASANLIKLNREAMITKTLQRFKGWSTSIPIGGSDNVDKNAEKATIKKALKSLPFEERRVIIDQGHKLTASLNAITADSNGAIAMMWHSDWKLAGYDYRPAHKARDEKVYIIRNSWADKQGLVKPVNGYLDEITQPSEEIYCRCSGQYIFTMAKLQRIAPECVKT